MSNVWDQFVVLNSSVIEFNLWSYCDDIDVIHMVRYNQLSHRTLNIFNYPIKNLIHLNEIMKCASVIEYISHKQLFPLNKQKKHLQFKYVTICGEDITQIHLLHSITTLQLHSSPISLSKGILPPFLTSLYFGHEVVCQLSVDVLPPSLTYLSLGHYFNHPLPIGIFPQSLQYIELSNLFDQPLELGNFSLILNVFTFRL